MVPSCTYPVHCLLTAAPFSLAALQVFLRAGQRAVLDAKLTDTVHRAAITVQRYARGFLARKHVAAMRTAVILLQVRCSARLSPRQRLATYVFGTMTFCSGVELLHRCLPHVVQQQPMDPAINTIYCQSTKLPAGRGARHVRPRHAARPAPPAGGAGHPDGLAGVRRAQRVPPPAQRLGRHPVVLQGAAGPQVRGVAAHVVVNFESFARLLVPLHAGRMGESSGC